MATATQEQRTSRLSISIGSRAAKIHEKWAREVVLAKARVDLIADLLARGRALDEAELIADDVIEGARKLVVELLAHEHALC